MASTETNSKGDHLVELIVREESTSLSDCGAASEEISPLLTKDEKPKLNIFTISYPRRKPKEQVTELPDVSPVTQFMLWVWGGSRYSGLLCMAISSTIYFVMDVLSSAFPTEAIPLFEIAFARCAVILPLSYLWLRKSGQPVFGMAHVRKLLAFRALTGLLSMMSFMYWISFFLVSFHFYGCCQSVYWLSLQRYSGFFTFLCSLLILSILGILSMNAELQVFLARGLQLEKTGKVVNLQFMEAALAQLWGVGLSKMASSFGRLVGCLLILISVSFTMYIGPDKEMEGQISLSSVFP